MAERRILVHEVGLRDGLQAVEQIVPSETKLRWAMMLASSGVDIIQLGSFVHPQLVPQMADTDLLFSQVLADIPADVMLSGLVLNERGLERALACGVRLICMGVSASETHSRKNTRMSTGEALVRTLDMARAALSEGREVQVSVQSAFGCGFEGPVEPARVLDIVQSYLDAGLRRISLADTAGHGEPRSVYELCRAVRKLRSDLELTCHLHNTYGAGIANAIAALDAGVDAFETAFGGLGGCPFTRIAGGNVCTEDWVHLLQRLGFRQEIDLNPILAVTREAGEELGRELPGSLHRTGPIPFPPRTPVEAGKLRSLQK